MTGGGPPTTVGQSTLASVDSETAEIRRAPPGPTVAVVVPTRNELENVAPLVLRARSLDDLVEGGWEIVFVDDSDDGTPAEARRVALLGEPVRVRHREPADRSGGLSGAVLAGFAASEAPLLVVMDGDLQHPPELLPRLTQPLLEGRADIVVATRYVESASRSGLDGIVRRFVSSSSRRAVHLLIPRSRPVSDPLGGFFALRRDVIEGVDLEPHGFKILLEILARGDWERVCEVPYDFAPREHGHSKATVREGLRFGLHVAGLVGARPTHRGGGRARALVDSMILRIAFTVAALLAAFWYPLRSLVSSWDPANVTSMAAIVPFAVALLLVFRGRRSNDEPPIHDREVDYLLGLAALAAALFVLVVLPHRMGAAFWVRRVDLLALPLFLAGIVAVLFGTRALWRVRTAVLLTLLAWPIALRTVGGRIRHPLASATAGVLGWIADAANLGRLTADGRHFALARGGTVDLHPDLGAASMLLVCGIVGLSLAAAIRSGTGRTTAWLVALGLGALYANFLRLEVAVWSGDVWGIDAARAVAGSGGFAVTALLVVSAAAWFRVRGRRRPVATARRESRPPAVGRPALALGITAVIALGAASVTSSYTRFDRVANGLGDAKLAPLAASSSPDGFLPVDAVRSDGAPSGRATHLVFVPAVARAGPVNVVVDGLAVGDPGIQSSAALRERYPLHEYRLLRSSSVQLGYGQRGDVMVFATRGGARWIALSWAWPVRGDEGYERVVVSDHELATATSRLTGDPGASAPVGRASTRDLIALATGLVREQLAPRSTQLARDR